MINPDHVFAVVEVARSKAPLLRGALCQLPQLEWAHSSIEASDDETWTYALVLALTCTGRALFLAHTALNEHDELIEGIDTVLDSQVGTPSNEFPSLDLEEFEAELRAGLADLRASIPTLAIEDCFNAALGERVCRWVGLVADPAWTGSNVPLLHMTIERLCAMTTQGNLWTWFKSSDA